MGRVIRFNYTGSSESNPHDQKQLDKLSQLMAENKVCIGVWIVRNIWRWHCRTVKNIYREDITRRREDMSITSTASE
jgi:hypothetical protein